MNVYMILTKIFTSLFPLITVYAEDGPNAPSFVTSLVSWVAGAGAGIVAIFLIVSIVKDGMEYARGQGSTSVWKILGKVIFLIVLIGLIFLAVNYNSLGNTAKDIGDKGLNVISNEATNLLNDNP